MTDPIIIDPTRPGWTTVVGPTEVRFFRGKTLLLTWRGTGMPIPNAGDMVRLKGTWYSVSVRGLASPAEVKVQVRPWDQAGDIEAPFHLAEENVA